MNPDYTPAEIETRQVYGVHMQQRRNDAKIDAKLFENIVTENKEVGHTMTTSSRAICSLSIFSSFPLKLSPI